MSAHAPTVALQDPGPLQAPGLNRLGTILIGIGLLGLILAVVTDDGHGLTRIWTGLLQGMLLPLYLSIAGLFFIAVHNVGGAKWLTPYRRLIEGLTAGFPIAAIVIVLIALFGGAWLYDWVYLTHPLGSGAGHEHADLFHVHHGSKSAYMTWWRFAPTTILIVAAWWYLRNRFIKASLRQDVEGGSFRSRNLRLSVVYLFVFAFGFTLLTWDLLLALHVNWFSTMWGVYCFTSAVQTFLCVLLLVALWLRQGPLREHLPHHVLHDLGTWMVAWSCFCAYIGFDQYMLIYYANLDEETYWYVMRTQNGYGLQYVIEALIRWPLPFLGLMSQRVRANPRWLVTIASVVLLGNWLDWSWIINPAFAPDHYRSPFGVELLIGLGFAGGVLLLANRYWQRHGIVPKRDPDLEPTVHGEHLH